MLRWLLALGTVLFGSLTTPAQATDPAVTGPAGKDPAAKDPATQAEEYEPPAGFQRVRLDLYALDLPEGWRALYPNEWLRLRDQLPEDFPAVQPGTTDVFGPIDRWLENGYGGTALLAGVNGSFEAPTTEERLASVRSHWSETEFTSGRRREVVTGRVATVGRDAHPCLELEILGLGTGDRRDRALEIYASTSGREIVLSFRSFEADWEATEPTLRQMAASLTFVRPPKAPEELTDRLGEALWIGAVVGVMLLGLRFIARRGGPGRPPAA